MARKRRSRKSSRRWFARAFVPLSAIVLLLALGLVFRERLVDLWLTTTSPGQRLPDRGLTPAQQLDEAVVLGARELGVPNTRIGRRAGAKHMPHFEFRCPDRLHPITANRWLSRIFLDAGLEILDCAEDGPSARPKLEYVLAAGPRREARATLTVYPPIGDPPLHEAHPRLAILVDDLGHNYGRVARGVLDLGEPITVSVLPGLGSSRRLEREARRRGHAVFLHLPMEPEDYPAEDPGPLALFTRMGPDSVADLLATMARNFDHLDGFNNHMGSKASTDPTLVGEVLDWADREQLLVVDSYTASRSCIYTLAREREEPALRVDLFLDGEEEDEAGIMENLAEAAETARRRGWALVICHPRSETLAALEVMLPRLRDNGLRFVTVPQLFASLDASDPAPPRPRRTGPH
ncbi:MAG: divergent polysaccharide deacetylase family protein [Candidatus Krumholzibacteriia bacterium]